LAGSAEPDAPFLAHLNYRLFWALDAIGVKREWPLDKP
jgi:hypothetical protein